MAKRRATAYALFVRSFAKSHPTVAKQHLFKQAAVAWHKRRVASNPEVELRPDEVLVLYPTHLREDASIDIPAGVKVERIAETELRDNPSRRMARAKARLKRVANASAPCPSCRNPVSWRNGWTGGDCPHCGARVKVAS